MKRIQLLIASTLCLLLQTCEPVLASEITVKTHDALVASFSNRSPGDIVWIEEGTYTEASTEFRITNSGTATAPIIYRALPGKRVTFVETQGREDVMRIEASFVYLWGIEFMHTGPRTVYFASINFLNGDQNAIINCYIHDIEGAGVSNLQGTTRLIVYGNIIIYNGRTTGGNGDGNYGMYVKNNPGTGRKLIENNIFGYGWWWGLQVYGEAAGIDNVTMRNNTFFNNGLFYRGQYEYNFLVGLGSTGFAVGDSIVDNYSYLSDGSTGASAFIGFEAELRAPVIQRNLLVRGKVSTGFSHNTLTNPVVAGNKFYGIRSYEYFTPATYPNNTYAAVPTSGSEVFIIPNRYEAGRATVTIFNWSRAASVSIDPSGVLKVGDDYILHSALNFWGPPVLSGTYEGGNISIPMATGVTPLAPQSNPAWPPRATEPEFGCYVLTTDGSPLPISLKYFEATYIAPAVLVRWETLTESQVYRFYVLRGVDTIRVVSPKGPGVYTVSDTVRPGTYLYHLTEVDLDGNSQYFPPVTVSVPTDVVEPEPGQPLKFGIVEVFPNPFNPSTHIVFEVASGEMIHFSLYTMLGQLIARGDPKSYSPGRYTQEVDMTGLSSGIYFIRMVGSGVSTKKLLFIR